LGVTPPSVWRWHQAWQKGGRRALKAAGRAGRKSRLTKAQLGQLTRELLKGPQAHGFATDLWTLPRIAQLIKKRFGVGYHPGYLWWLLRRLEWTPQKPARRAKERNEAAISHWLTERWPRLKKRANAGVPPSFSPTKADSPSAPV
jgi:transposase